MMGFVERGRIFHAGRRMRDASRFHFNIIFSLAGSHVLLECVESMILFSFFFMLCTYFDMFFSSSGFVFVFLEEVHSPLVPSFF